MNLFISFLALVIFNLTLLAQQWEWCNPVPTGNPLAAVAAVNSNTCFAFGEFGTVIRTTDGGQHWVNLTGRTDSHFAGAYFINPYVGWTVGGSSG